jgi:putative molybdopterin biosynthesis protein
MDGYAVRAVDTAEASPTSPVELAVGPQAQYVDAGDPLPAWADAVVMIEKVQPLGDDRIEIRDALAPWTAVRPMGEDMVATELILPANHVLRPVDLGALRPRHPRGVPRRSAPRSAARPSSLGGLPAGNRRAGRLRPDTDGPARHPGLRAIPGPATVMAAGPHRFTT